MPSRCLTLKGKGSSRLICKSSLSSVFVFPFSEASGMKKLVWGLGRRQPSLLCPELSPAQPSLGAPSPLWAPVPPLLRRSVQGV